MSLKPTTKALISVAHSRCRMLRDTKVNASGRKGIADDLRNDRKKLGRAGAVRHLGRAYAKTALMKKYGK